MDIRAIIDEARAVYAAAGLDCGNALLPPASCEELDEMSEALALPVPDEPSIRAVLLEIIAAVRAGGEPELTYDSL